MGALCHRHRNPNSKSRVKQAPAHGSLMFRYNDNRASSEDSSVRFRGAREATFTEVMNKFGRGLSVIDGRFRRGAEVV